MDETLHRGKVIGLSKGETVYFKATLGNAEGNPNLDGFSRGSGMIWHYFIMEGSIKADGNIQFLLESTGTKMDVPGRCYQNMFQGCTSLTQAPTLPATILTDFCYYKMFSGCTSLNSINVNFSAWNPPDAIAGGATYDWVYNVSSSGTFACPAGLPEEFGSDKIPSGWTVVRK